MKRGYILKLTDEFLATDLYKIGIYGDQNETCIWPKGTKCTWRDEMRDMTYIKVLHEYLPDEYMVGEGGEYRHVNLDTSKKLDEIIERNKYGNDNGVRIPINKSYLLDDPYHWGWGIGVGNDSTTLSIDSGSMGPIPDTVRFTKMDLKGDDE